MIRARANAARDGFVMLRIMGFILVSMVCILWPQSNQGGNGCRHCPIPGIRFFNKDFRIFPVIGEQVKNPPVWGN
jgi:hypothetical protein